MKKILSIISIIFLISAFDGRKEPAKDFEIAKFEKESLLLFPVINNGEPLKIGDKKYSDEHILVKFKEKADIQQAMGSLKSMGLRQIKKLEKLEVYVMAIPEGEEPEEICEALNSHPDILYAEPDYIAYACVKPNDRYFTYQYYLLNEGQNYCPPLNKIGRAGADVKITDAWDREKGSENIIIAIVDTGVYLQHEDLKDKIIGGFDFVNNDADPSDDHWHGTHVAGIAGASTNNAIGIAGVGWNAKIMPIKVLDSTGSGYYSWIADGIEWAVDRGAKVINLSLGGETSSFVLEEAVNYAFSKGALCIAAAGNDRNKRVLYPAAYKNCLAVGATNDMDLDSGWHSKGPEVDVSAPGELIFSTFNPKYQNSNANYAWATGTSMATPIVSGLAALIYSKNPSISPKDLMNLIKYTCDDVNSSTFRGVDEFLGYGRINAKTAVLPYRLK